ncbi:M24 family metallopeptidase [Thetidibacter halocola]|uniref:Aminopeptidase P family protein n=1 Tax=Thetidibacter halocola TaxID=2827239 RepID=A0A8J8B7S9_9RHOB|nr:Xaa-Pro peptidase family protein [Thetidibacter halocola]MBS0125446.1 aminopeptidase P family protein [Thetidibacter halocola]
MTLLLPPTEYHARRDRLQALMATRGLDALLLTTDSDIRHVTGFLTRFWESPTRPWFIVVPASGNPVAVIPSIGAHLMGQGWIADIRTWSSPDYEDDGVSLLAAALAETVPPGGAIAAPDHDGTHLRMPLADWARLQALLPDRRFAGDGGTMRIARMVKSEAEIALIRQSCAIAGRAFARVSEIAAEGVPLETVFRRFQALCLEEGADWVPYVAGASAPGGYGDVISPATDVPLARGDVLMLDTGLIRQGYFCDFDRNYSVGQPSAEVARGHATLVEATQAAFDAARPGATAADLFHVMARIVGETDAGRLGHGLGMQLTEPPSLIPADQTVLEPGMVLTLEPAVTLGPGRILVHEENIVIRETGPEWLSPPAPLEIPVI